MAMDFVVVGRAEDVFNYMKRLAEQERKEKEATGDVCTTCPWKSPEECKACKKEQES